MFDLIKNKSLKNLNRFKTGGNAEFFFTPKSQEDLINFLQQNHFKKIFILGGGTNILIRDKGIAGLTIYIKNLNKHKIEEDRIVCEAGMENIKIYLLARNNEISGYEFLGTIPGTIGGACKMNAGCYGAELKDVLLGVKTITANGKIKYFSVEECKMEYRKNNLPKNLIFLEIYLKKNPTTDKNLIEKIFQQNLKKREDTQPFHEKTCGCTFKNPDGIPTWKLIQEIGLQNLDLNGAKFSEKHANFLVNHNNAKSKDLEKLILLAKKKVKKEKNIILETEIKIVGLK